MEEIELSGVRLGGGVIERKKNHLLVWPQDGGTLPRAAMEVYSELAGPEHWRRW